ncbi:DNA cytosine methyltransferase [Subtercola lobariae]|uniref:Cytosine-specific methyltransferase n=1 Tax=Subtercola lobariae TaxID=1588641 RepID=A0A917EUU8_9MICO|nr:DNA (cytosine-5-)-methyltransferase [Subtercola lobariae]GGF15278.1 putative BsuMI modification methylase subunit YdiP [Subtercola lobariae]
MHPETPILSLFSGVGGFELGFRKAGFSGEIHAYENWGAARAVLEHRLPNSVLHEDVRGIPNDLHNAEIVFGGFPCTDLSQAGRQAGIQGSASGLILGVLEAVQRARPEWVLLENVPNMLWLKQGNAMEVITGALSTAGYKWAYRMLDAQHFGVAQRRKRVFILASLHQDPSRVLFRDLNVLGRSTGPVSKARAEANGFYWTEGNRGVGWGAGVVPTIKGSTTAGIPSSPAVWIPRAEPELRFRTPSIESLEMLQGFRAGWTSAAPTRDRWKLVGNAVAVPVVRWIADGLRAYDRLSPVGIDSRLSKSSGWDWAGVSAGSGKATGKIPTHLNTGSLPRRHSLARLLQTRGSHALSAGAARGFAGRLGRSRLTYDRDFMNDLMEYSRA